MKSAEDLLLLSNDERTKEIVECKEKDKLIELAGDLIKLTNGKNNKDGIAFNVGLVSKGDWLKKVGYAQIQQQIISLIRQFPEPQSTELAIDRTFSDQRAKLDAIIDDINTHRMPVYRYAELLHENLFKDDYENLKLKSSRTFLAYAFVKLKKPYEFFSNLQRNLGQLQFSAYMQTPMILGVETKTVDKAIKIVDIEGLYLKDHTPLNLVEFDALNKNPQLKDIFKYYLPKGKAQETRNYDNIDTHNVSSHKSADESHVGAFKLMIETHPSLSSVKVEFAAVKPGDSPRAVEITNRGGLDAFVKAQLDELNGKIGELIKTDNATLYNLYIRASDKATEYNALNAEEKLDADKKIASLLWQSNAAKRFMNNMLQTRKCDSGSYSYNTNDAATCGLTMEEMVATCYWASHDTKNFKTPSKAPDILFAIIRQLYDMRRGYDIDNGTDKPEKHIYPATLGTDNNRCHGGGVNSLASALNSIHNAYNVKTVLREDIEKHVKALYEQIIKNNPELMPNEKAMLITWSATGKITGEFRILLETVFNSRYRKEIEDLYKGYVPDNVFEDVLLSGLDNIPIPPRLKEVWALEKLSDGEIVDSIANEGLPPLHLDDKKGYQSTLNYLNETKPNLIQYVLDAALKMDRTTPRAQKILLYLSHSRLEQKYKDAVIHKVESKEITLKSISILSSKVFEKLVNSENASGILEISIEQNIPELFAFYALNIGFKPEELTRQLGSDKYTPLYFAIKVGNLEIMKMILEADNDKKSLLIKDSNGYTPLHLAAKNGHKEAVEMILEADNDKKSLLMKDNYGNTPLHFAAMNDHTAIVEMILTVDNDKKSLLIKHSNGYTPLHFAAMNDHTAIVEMILKENKGKKSLLMKDNYGYTPLHFAAMNDHTAIVEMILTVDNDKKSLLIKDSNGYTPLHLAAMNGHTATVGMILKENKGKESLLMKDNYESFTPLHLAAYRGHTATMEMILKEDKGKESLLMKDNYESFTPLHLAAKWGKTEIAEMIFTTKQGIESLKIENIERKRPFYVAMDNNNTEVRNLICKALITQAINTMFSSLFSSLFSPITASILGGIILVFSMHRVGMLGALTSVAPSSLLAGRTLPIGVSLTLPKSFINDCLSKLYEHTQQPTTKL